MPFFPGIRVRINSYRPQDSSHDHWQYETSEQWKRLSPPPWWKSTNTFSYLEVICQKRGRMPHITGSRHWETKESTMPMKSSKALILTVISQWNITLQCSVSPQMRTWWCFIGFQDSSMLTATTCIRQQPRWGYSHEFWIGMCCEGLWTLPLFKDWESENWYPF